jgi:hypothetical protein
LGVGTVATAYATAKAVAAAEAEKIAKAVVNDTAAKVATDEIIKLKTKAEQQEREIAKLKEDAKGELTQIRSKRDESVKIVSGLAPEIEKTSGKTLSIKSVQVLLVGESSTEPRFPVEEAKKTRVAKLT